MTAWLNKCLELMPEGVKYVFIYLLGILTYWIGVKLYENHLTLKYVKKEHGSDQVVVVSVKRWDRNAIEHFTKLGYERSTRHG